MPFASQEPSVQRDLKKADQPHLQENPSAASAADLAAHLDRLAIRDLSARFADAANRIDPEVFRSLWTENSVWTIGPPADHVFKGREAIVAGFTSLLQNEWEFFVQLPSAAHVIDLNGDTASGRCYVNEIARAKFPKTFSNFNLSVYEDECVRENGVWRFRSRRYKVIYLDKTPLGGQVINS